jgi:hypothetical protein
MTKNTFKPIRVTDPRAIESAKLYVTARDAFNKEVQMMTVRHRREAEELVTLYKKQFRLHFRGTTEGLLDDPDECFAKNSHFIDLRYIELGDVYVIGNDEVLGPQEESEETSEGSPPVEQRRIVIN